MIDIEKFLISLRGHKDAEGKANSIYLADTVQEEVKIIEEAIAQSTSVQEPVGCACRWNDEGDRTVTCERHQGWLEVIAEWADRAREAEAKLKATPPAAQRQWVGLTDEEIYDSYNEPRSDSEMVAFAREVEAKLKEKNT